jgi:DNA-binding CsgD family transcriptional regulator/PAS domain-containing protein
MGEPDLLTAIDAIYASALDPERWPEALSHMTHVAGGIGAVIVPVTAADEMVTIASASLEESNRDYSREWWHHDIRKEKVLARGPMNGLITDADLLDDVTLRTHPFCQEFSRRHGLGAYMGYVTVLPSKQIITVGVHRDLRHGPFETADKDNFARLAPHAARAIAAAAEIAEGRRASRLLRNTLDRLTRGVILLDVQGGVVAVSETARSMLGTGFTVSRGRLKAATTQDQKALDALVMSALPGRTTLVRPPLVLARHAGGERKVLVQAIPVAGGEQTSFEHLALRPGVLVLVHDLSTPALEVVQERLVRLGLTKGQARIAAAVGSGLSSKEAAAQLRLTDGTIRTVLKAVYQRLDISRQSQLVALVTKLGSLPELR